MADTGPRESSPGIPADRPGRKPAAYTILIVDDSAAMRSVIKRTLHQCDLPIQEICEAANGQEGLALLNAKRFNLALVDLHMPIMDGEQMVNQMRQVPLTAKMPVIFVSSESSPARICILLKEGSGFVHKPFTPEILQEEIIHAMETTHEPRS